MTRQVKRELATVIGRDGGAEACCAAVPVPCEHRLTVTIGDRPSMSITCTPTDLDALVAGRLLTEGIIEGRDQIISLALSEDEGRMRVLLTQDATLDARGSFESVPTYGAAARPLAAKAGNSGVYWTPAMIFALADEFATDTPTHRATNGVHSCYLAFEGVVRYCCEDLGRHNALDKVVGKALLAGDDLSRALLFSSGRIPVDMMVKAARAGIPLLATKAVPTDAAIAMARARGVVLIGQARPDSFTVFSQP